MAALRRRERDELDGAARTALAASHARGVRLRRIAKLKALLLGPGKWRVPLRCIAAYVKYGIKAIHVLSGAHPRPMLGAAGAG